MNDLILYTTEDGRSQIKLRADQQTVWLTQLEIAELFDASKQNISLHLKNIFADEELDPSATVKQSLTVQTEGSRKVQRSISLFNLDAILAVGYRVRSPRGVQFRRWASTSLKEYLLKGFVMDDERLKNPDGRPDYFDEMLARIRDIRASEKRFYQKVRDLFALSSDYDKTDQTTQTFFATVQNLLLYAVTQKTAAELITARANPADPHFGLLHWKGAQVRKQDILVAKNYLSADEIDTLNRLVVIFLETAELRTKSRQEIRMPEHIDKIIKTYQFRKEEPRYARRVAMEEIEKNDFNLNISRYVSTAVGEAEIDLDAVHAELVEVEKAIMDAKKRHNRFLKELGLKPLP
ncbi:MAG: virulence RhuM family protein [Aquabacterium sp.]|uniref:RhuM family protein n=1 Tax=Aquabacterium sp. TaxID=1872578 RepID=UPI001DA644E5|nr:RhuM family protein [Aquabacterium sp.]MBT9611001.1 virulence RhuM family protein [Aquabacterium sp.]